MPVSLELEVQQCVLWPLTQLWDVEIYIAYKTEFESLQQMSWAGCIRFMMCEVHGQACKSHKVQPTRATQPKHSAVTWNACLTSFRDPKVPITAAGFICNAVPAAEVADEC
jgi:hypothetical protein